MKLSDVVATSQRVAAAASRNAKVAALAERLRQASPEEVPAVVAWLSGEVRQGRIGVGFRALQEAAPGGASEAATLTVRDVDGAFAALAATSGKGARAAKLGRLSALLTRATAVEQRFLLRLLGGALCRARSKGSS